MTLRNGHELLAMPGPTNVPDAVLAAMHRPAIDIYAGDLLNTTEACLTGLRTAFATQQKVYIYAANGHGAWEAALSNVLSRGEQVLVLESGRFAPGWGLMAEALGAEVQTLPGSLRAAVEPDRVEARLREDTERRIRAILVVQVDTATGVVNDIPAIRAAIDASGHDALLLVDAIASLCTMPFEMDGWGVDVAVTGSQKGLMMSPGLSFCAAGPRALEAHQRADLRTRYWDWTQRDGPEHYQKYCGTPPEHLLFGLQKSLELLLHEGLDNIFERHRLLAGAVRCAIEVWSEGGAFEFNILDSNQRADSTTTVRMRDGYEAGALQTFCRESCGVTLGRGIGDLQGEVFRIAHMGHINAPMILGTLGSVDLALTALKMPHGAGGVQAAVDWLGEELAG